jgi:hypothetical protein
MVNPEPARGIARSVGSLAPDNGRYQHSACTTTEIFGKGDIFLRCTNLNCANKGANWRDCDTGTEQLKSGPLLRRQKRTANEPEVRVP